MQRFTEQPMEQLFDRYVSARGIVIENGYEAEMEWQKRATLDSVSEPEFLREAAWVILNSGMREATVRRAFPSIERAFCYFSCSSTIVDRRHECVRNAAKVFNHMGKLTAIVGVACRINVDGFSAVKGALTHYGVQYLRSFDFLGPATSRHLAKNLGVGTSKPDRHLQRIAATTGFGSVADLCRSISEWSGDSESVVDLVMWRFATLNKQYLQFFNLAPSSPDSEDTVADH